MTNLTTLLISSNSFMGEIPSELGLLTNLTILSLAENALQGKLPPIASSVVRSTLYLCSHQLLIFRECAK
jgi:hypothetical protein